MNNNPFFKYLNYDVIQNKNIILASDFQIQVLLI